MTTFILGIAVGLGTPVAAIYLVHRRWAKSYDFRSPW